MSRQRTAKEICERALRAIGAFAITDSGADGEQLRETMDWLDMIMAERAGVQTLFTLIPGNLSVPLTNGTSTYNLNTALGTDLPLDKVQFPVDAWLEDAAGRRSPIEIATRSRFEAVCSAGDVGQPQMIYIDRTVPTPTLRTYPSRAATDTSSADTLKLVVQTYAPNVSPGGVTGTQPSASILTNFSQAWQRWLTFTLASDIGSGPVKKLPKASLDNFNSKAGVALVALQAFENREHDTEPPLTAAWD